MNQQRKESWVEARGKGQTFYVWASTGIYGSFALLVIVIWSLIELVWKEGFNLYFLREPVIALISIVGCAIAGYLQASREWRRRERKFLVGDESKEQNHSIV